MTQESLLSDDLLRQLVAVGQVDVLVGLPTLNHASTIPDVVRAVQASFSTYFPRLRTVLLNSDGGSDDNSPALVRDCCRDESGTVTVSHNLRTTHRISTPYHGMPGKANALRRIFAVSDLLGAGAVVVLDPEVSSLTPEWVAALARPIRDEQFDFVAPVYPRHPLDGLLVTQLLRPLIRAGYGWRVREPLAVEFGCSRAFAAHCVGQPVWDSDLTQNSIDLWLTSTALAGSFRTCQTWLGPRVLAAGFTGRRWRRCSSRLSGRPSRRSTRTRATGCPERARKTFRCLGPRSVIPPARPRTTGRPSPSRSLVT